MKKRRLIDLIEVIEEEIHCLNEDAKPIAVESEANTMSATQLTLKEVTEVREVLEQGKTEINAFSVIPSHPPLPFGSFIPKRKGPSSQWKDIEALSEFKVERHPSWEGYIVFSFGSGTHGKRSSRDLAHDLKEVFAGSNISKEKVSSQVNHNLLIVEEAALKSVFKERGKTLSLNIEPASQLLKTQLQDKKITIFGKSEENYLIKLREHPVYHDPFCRDNLIVVFDKYKDAASAANHYATAINRALAAFDINAPKASSSKKHNILIVAKDTLKEIFKRGNYGDLPVASDPGATLIEKLQQVYSCRKRTTSQPAKPLTIVTTTSQTTSTISELPGFIKAVMLDSVVLEPNAKKIATTNKVELSVTALSDLAEQTHRKYIVNKESALQPLQSTVKQLQDILEKFHIERQSVDGEEVWGGFKFNNLISLSNQLLSCNDPKEILEGVYAYKEEIMPFMSQVKQGYPHFYETKLAPLMRRLTTEIEPQTVSHGRV